MTNSAGHNEIIAYKRGPDGSLEEGQSFRTGGRGSSGVTDPLGSQGSLTISQDHSLLFAVNAGSGDISVFRVHGFTLSLLDKVPCSGSEPVAVAQHGNLVYVVNAGGSSNVVGFHLDSDGKLKPIAGSIAFLPANNSGAASLSFSPDGQFLLVTEKLTNNIDAFHIQIDGTWLRSWSTRAPALVLLPCCLRQTGRHWLLRPAPLADTTLQLSRPTRSLQMGLSLQSAPAFRR